ncbi:hypothetical protein [Actinomycetospora sp. CA-053990]|uniref:hypothetical protein n=1 Tax=Actinomycetospora sp. CA-053990 TaxID=3239891 RepID=UPI003D94A51B
MGHQERALLRRWVPVVALAEVLGFALAAVVGVLTVGSPVVLSLPLLVAAGAVEGALLGTGQALVLRSALPAISVTRWVLATAGAAAVAYLLALLPSTTATVTAAWPAPVLVVSTVALGLLVLLTIGLAQWWELRRHVEPAAAWIGVTALAWLLGLGIFLAVATPLWHAGQAVPVTVLVGLVAGGLMALVMAAVTGVGLVVLLRGPQGRATGPGTSGETFGPGVGPAEGGSSGAIPVRRGERS